jgi:hypothetical protein
LRTGFAPTGDGGDVAFDGSAGECGHGDCWGGRGSGGAL